MSPAPDPYADIRILSQTTGVLKACEERGETTTRTISGQRTGGVTEKKDRLERMNKARLLAISETRKAAKFYGEVAYSDI